MVFFQDSKCLTNKIINDWSEQAECKETWENGRTDIVGISIELLDNEKIYKKIN